MNSEEHPHPLLAQLPLTVSPFVALPSGVPLPYSYKQLAPTLPPSVTDPRSSSIQPPGSEQQSSTDQQQHEQAAYVISPNTGHSAHPDQIIANCQALQQHLQKLQDDAVATIQKWQSGISEREIMEKRRVAPGWLDVDQKMLVPEKKEKPVQSPPPAAAAPTSAGLMDIDDQHQMQHQQDGQQQEQPNVSDGGAELDRAFGGMGLR